MTEQRKAELLLLFVAIVWGSTFVIVKEAIPYSSAAPFTTVRFILASIIGYLFFRRKLTSPITAFSKTIWWQGFVLASLFAIGYLFQTYGLAFTTVPKSAFITGMIVVLVPFAQIIVLKKRITVWQLFGVISCFIGIWLFTQPESLTDINIGDILTLLGATLWSFYIVYINKYVEVSNDVYQTSLQLTLAQFFITVPISALFWVFEPTFFSEVVGSITTYRSILLFTPEVIWAIAYTAIIASVVATYIQMVYQPKTSPIKASVIFSIEPIVASIIFFLVSTTMLSEAEIYGSLCIFVGIGISEFGSMLFKKTEKMNNVSDPKPIIFFDGVCGLCTASVQLLLKFDTKHKLQFSPLQGTTYSKIVGSFTDTFDSIIVVSNGKQYEEFSALRIIGKELGGFWNFLSICSYLIPLSLGNFFYRLIARNRYHVFGKHSTCMLPTIEQKAQFLP